MRALDPMHNLRGSRTVSNTSGDDEVKRDPKEQFRRDRDRERACGAAVSRQRACPRPCKDRRLTFLDRASDIPPYPSQGGRLRAADWPELPSNVATVAQTRSVVADLGAKPRASHPPVTVHGLPAPFSLPAHGAT